MPLGGFARKEIMEEVERFFAEHLEYEKTHVACAPFSMLEKMAIRLYAKWVAAQHSVHGTGQPWHCSRCDQWNGPDWPACRYCALPRP